MSAPRPPHRSGPRTEWKATLDRAHADSLFESMKDLMRPDPHARDHASCGYLVESIYFVKATLDCFECDGGVDLPKYRVRRYGQHSDRIFLEEKLRRGLEVWKRRIEVPASLLARHLASLFGDGAVEDDGVAWYRSKIRMLRLRPTLLVVYERRALVGADGERLTVDLQMRATRLATPEPTFEPAGLARTLGVESVLEIKFEGGATKLVQLLMERVDRVPQACSKYRHAVLAFGPECWRERSA